MKRILKMGLAALLSLLMLVIAFPVNVFASMPVCMIGDTSYNSISDAYAAAENGSVINIIADTTVSSFMIINKKITLTSENESVITCNITNAFIINDENAELTVSGNLKMIGGNAVVNLQAGALNVMGGTIEAADSTISVDGAARLNVSGGVITTTSSGHDISTVTINAPDASVTVSGGTIMSSNTRAIEVNAPNATLNITGGTIKARHQTIFYNSNGSGTLNISGDNTVIKTDRTIVTSNANTNHTIYLNCVNNKVTVNMTGGTVSSDNESTFYCNGRLDANISGGNITAVGKQAFMLWKTANITITGGNIYSSEKTINYTQGEGGGSLTITGGTVTAATQDTIFFSVLTKNMTCDISGGTLIAGTQRVIYYGNVGTSINTNITGGTLRAAENTITAPGGSQTINLSGGTITATNSIALNCDGPITSTVINISDDVKMEAGSNAMLIKMPGITVNVNGGYIKSNGGCVAVAQRGTLNVYDGILELNGTSSDALMIHGVFDKNLELSGTVNILGGLFINENMGNSALFGVDDNATPINYTDGKLMYASNVKYIIKKELAATHTTEAIYDRNSNGTVDAGESYYLYNRFAASSKNVGIMVDGAAVRLVENSNGLRFTTKYSAEVVSALKAKGDVTYGTIIVPTEYLTSLDSFTLEALVEKYGADKILNIVCTAENGLVTNENGSVITQAAIVNIKEANYGVAFSAISYACVNGEYYYSAYDQGVNARTIKDVAAAALADTEADYTDAQVAILNAYVAEINA